MTINNNRLCLIISILLFIISCNNNKESNSQNKSSDTVKNLIENFSDSSQINKIKKYTRQLKVDSTSMCDYTDYKPVFKWVKKMGTLKLVANSILIMTDEETLCPCNLQSIKIGKDSSILFSGISYKKKKHDPYDERIACSTILTDLYFKTNEAK